MGKKLNKIVISLIIAASVCVATVYAGGLSSNWGEVFFDNLELGNVYQLNQVSKNKFKVINNFDSEINLKVEILKPQVFELKPGYEAIEDISWVKIENPLLNISPAKEGLVNLTITIPEAKNHRGKKYQFWVWSYTVGQAVGAGLKSRILISVKE